MARKNEGQMKMDVGTGERISRCARNDGGGRPMTAPTENGGRAMPAPTSGRQSAVPTKDGALWQVKKRGSAGVSSHAENCGYDERTVKSLQERGWHLYKDGEKVW